MGGAAAIGIAGVGVATRLGGRGDRRRLAARVAEIRPRPAAVRGVSATPKRPARLKLLDPLLGIERATASDEPLSPFPALVTGGIAAGFTFVVATFLLTLPFTPAVAAAAMAAVLAARSAVAGKRGAIRLRMEDEFALALGVIIRCVRVGLPVVEGMRAAAAEVSAPTGPEFRRCVDQIMLGEDFDAALVQMARRCALPDYRFFAVSVALQRQTGGNLAETLENLADTVRKRKAIRLRAQSLTSETKATVMVLSLLPIAIGALMMAVQPSYVTVLFTTATGRLLLGAAVVIQAIGLFIIRALIRRSLG